MSGPEFGQPDNPDPRPDEPGPLFFLSYAHSPEPLQHRGGKQSRNWRFIKFFEDLSENVAELVTRRAGSDPGYMDSSSIPAGGRWSEELSAAVGSCQVFVALLSPRYIESPMCGKEWHAFSQRRIFDRQDGRVSNKTAIIPVIWAPVREPDVPPVIGKLQRFRPPGIMKSDIAGPYEREGIVGLLQLDESVYQAVVWRVAQYIAELSYTHRVERHEYKFDELRNVFEKRVV